ncbi:MAG: delta-lactam-biosynthetic de-N-acetylase [Clostridia bacterium]|nr:delta-lactam-biosynthetic de-N-acetylase [Clostridia bacterium]
MKRFVLPAVLAAVFLCGCTSQGVFETEITQVIRPVEIAVPADENPGVYGALSNEKNGWGLKKNKNAPPDIPQKTIDLITRYGGICYDSAPRALYLTFDEGYENGFTAKILDVLKENGVPAAFFVTGPYLEKEKELVLRMTQEGHIVGNHTVHHPSMPEVASAETLKKEITELNDQFFSLTGEKMQFFRPPMGEYSARTLAITRDLGYTTVFWSFAYKDWEVKNQKGTDYAYTQIMEGVHDGAILLLHAVSEDNANVLDRVIKDLKSQGYRFLPLTEFGKNVNGDAKATTR